MKIHQKTSFSSAQCARNFYIAMKRELKMNTRNTCSGVYLCVHFQRYLCAHAEDMREKRERFLQEREGKFGHMSAHKITRQTHLLKGKRERENTARFTRVKT